MKGKLIFIINVLYITLIESRHPLWKPPSAEEDERIKEWTPGSKQSMWEISGQFEGDIIVSSSQKNGEIQEEARWPNREIPYEIDSSFTSKEKELIINSLKKEYEKTCIKVRFRKPQDKDYIYVTGDDTGCWSQVGRQGGRQILNLKRKGCLSRGTIAHEFLHALGFWHMQSAPERDHYVSINWENILKGTEHNFNKYSSDKVTSFGEKYDYDSVMHYGAYAFSANGEATIIPKDSDAKIGNRDGLSTVDIIKLHKMYDCDSI